MAQYDYVAIGAGSAGYVVANRLTEDAQNNSVVARWQSGYSNPVKNLCQHYGRIKEAIF